MRNDTFATFCLLVVMLTLSGCSDAQRSTPVAPSAVSPPPAAIPPVSPGQGWLDGYTLTAASLSGVVSESTPNGRVPIAGAVVYCELCGQTTHTWATADANGFYRFSGDIATGGGVWLNPGRGTPIMVGGPDFETQATFVGKNLTVPITAGDTRFDVELVRR